MTDNLISLARGLVERKEFAQAWQMVSEILNTDPDEPKALYIAGTILREQGHTGMALQMFRRALLRASNVPNVWMHFGACLHDTHQYEDARTAFRTVAKALPKDAMPIANIAATYVQQGNANLAVEWADKAMQLDSENHIAHIAKAFGSLGLGRWEDGWKYSDALYGGHINRRIYSEDGKPEPTWDGTKGQTVIVQCDQGLGDIIMFSQCLPEMAKDCKEVIVETSTRMASILKRNFPELTVYDTLKQNTGIEWVGNHKIDAHIHISAVGRHYRKRNEDFPRKAYLTPDEGFVGAWQKWLEKYPKPWVGIAWKGGIPQTNTVARSMSLSEFAPIINAGGTVFSLAYQDVDLEVARWNVENHSQVITPPLKNAGDYENTLAFISCMDHVVTVTTTVVHACGAMGKKAQVLVNALPQWRYVYGGDSLIWYPEDSVRLYRQAKGETSWGPAIKRLSEDYSTFIYPRLAHAA